MIARTTNPEDRMPAPKRRNFWLLVLPLSVVAALWLGWAYLVLNAHVFLGTGVALLAFFVPLRGSPHPRPHQWRLP
jgi:hypothetical protein